MTNKIVILNDSVLLYEHYIDDDRWERTLAFPRGGLTYLISNGTIKFYAYEDYFYRNCLISMQLPIYIVDEFMHIDGEYSDIAEITEILDRIFPTNDIDAQLDMYLTKLEAEDLYQPIGDYALRSEIPDVSDFVTTDDLIDALEDYYTKDETDDLLDDKADKDDVYTKQESDERFQPKGDYLTSGDTYLKGEIDDKLADKLDASAYTPCDLSNYYTKQETSGKTEIANALNALDNKKLDASAYTPTDLSNYYTKQETSGKTQLSTAFASKQDKLIAGENITISGNVISAAGGSEPIDAYTKQESDARFQPKGNYATESWVLNQNYITSSSTVFNNYYTTANTYSKQEVNQFITNLQNQINTLVEQLNACCSTPEPQYRWNTAQASDYLCDGVDKYYKQYYEVSYDGGTTWQRVEPEQTRKGSLIEHNSTDCGYVPPTPTIEYRWVTVDGQYVCSGYDKYTKEKKQQSEDGGEHWTDVSPAEYRQGSTLIEANSEDCGYVPPTPTMSGTYLTFIASEDGTFKFTGNGTIPNKASYSLDSGSTWTELASGVNTPTIQSGSTIMWKGTMTPSESSPYGIGTFSSSGRFVVEGNPMSLLYGDNFENQTSLANKSYGFDGLFSGCTKLTSIDDMVLVATTLGDRCYGNMFYGCTSLTSVPQDLLPATTMKIGCYFAMFRGCTSLTNVPDLPATTLASNCYNSMFYDCTSLTSAKKLPATNLAQECYHMMFRHCTSLVSVPQDMLPATVLEVNHTLANRCYGMMFYECINLTTAPDLPALTLVYQCYNGMFEYCQRLSYIKCLATSINADGATTAWVNGVASSGRFVKNANMNSWPVCDGTSSGIPCAWTIENNS